LLDKLGTLTLNPKNNGLYAASSSQGEDAESGYQRVWVRDNIMVANYQRERGRPDLATKTLRALASFFHLHRTRFIHVIENPEVAKDPCQRPHVRFDGDTLRELDRIWPHDQNDALGYAMWLTFLMANAGQYVLDEIDVAVYSLFPDYFRAIQYWRSPDSGHWEEDRRVNSSSIGVVLRALEEYRRYFQNAKHQMFKRLYSPVDVEALDSLVSNGRAALRSLPNECLPIRGADAATLFLIYPVDIADRQQGDAVIDLVVSELQGDYGIRRYTGDSYWCQDYDVRLPAELRTVDHSTRIEARNILLSPHCEAQWCIFDPILSVIFGRRFQETRSKEDLAKQVLYLNRSLSQITPDGKCPELYYLRTDVGGYITNAHTPLAWCQANLGIALHYMKVSLSTC
jgi:phosphorylase kinase alpha/beta subunit